MTREELEKKFIKEFATDMQGGEKITVYCSTDDLKDFIFNQAIPEVLKAILFENEKCDIEAEMNNNAIRQEIKNLGYKI